MSIAVKVMWAWRDNMCVAIKVLWAWRDNRDVDRGVWRWVEGCQDRVIVWLDDIVNMGEWCRTAALKRNGEEMAVRVYL